MKSRNKGQAALEFMMTYGWAILVVLAAIGALSYFGILNPARFTPDTCLAGSGFACPGKPIVSGGTTTTDGQLVFSVVNGLGYSVNLSSTTGSLNYTNINCGSVYVCKQGDLCTAGNTSQIVEDGAGATIRMINCNFKDVSVVKGELNFIYKNRQSGLNETLKVSVTGKPKD